MHKQVINIIIAEDNKQFVEGLKIVLKQCPKCRIVDVCSNGKELVDSDFLIIADLIISDIEMPVMNGIEAARQINIAYPELPMIAITMHVEEVYLEALISAGFKGGIFKPEVSQHLCNVIKQVLDKKYVFPNKFKI